MKHLLVDCDSKIPNLALMKISRHVKSLGAEPELCQLKGRPLLKLKHVAMVSEGQVERAWISTIFTWNRSLAWGLAHWLVSNGVPVSRGGTGFSETERLPDEIERLAPDYELYGDDRAVGYSQRGCPLKCPFCIVPIKEGRLSDNEYVPLEGWVPDGFKKVLLLDNNLSMSPHEPEVLETCREKGWKLSITQGYNIRSVTEEKAKRLAENKPWDLKFGEHRLYIAWDFYAIGPAVEKGLQTLINAGFKGREIMCYCLVGFNSSHLQDYARFHVLWKKYGVLPFLMRYNLRRDDKFLNALARYTNRGPASYRGHSFLDYCGQDGRGITPEIREEARSVVDWVESGKKVPLEIPYQMPSMGTLYH